MNVIVYILFKVILLTIFLSGLTKFKYNLLKSSIVVVSFQTAIFLLNTSIFLFGGVELMGNLFPITTLLPGFLCFSLVSRYRGFKILFSLLTVSIFGTLTSYIEYLSLLVFKVDFISRLSQFVSLGLLVFFIIKIFRKRYFEMLESLDRAWGLFCMVPLLLLTVIFLLQYYPSSIMTRTENVPVVFFVYILVFAFDMIIYINFKNISEYFQLKRDKEHLMIHTEMQKKEYAALMDQMNATRIYRHDMRHHINALSGYLSDKNISDAQRYLSLLENNLIETVIHQYCDNYNVNVILSSYISKAQQEQIEVTPMVVLSDHTNVDDIDLGVIFANAIENAIKACKEMPDISKRNISITCKETSGQICIQITNPYIGSIHFNGEYPVAEDPEHGYGTKSIASIVDKYGGIFSFTAQDGIFKTSVILNLL